MSFMTMRSTLGMAKHIVKLSRHLRKTIIAASKQSSKFKQAVQLGSVDAVQKSWKELFDAYAEEEKEINELVKDEQIELRNEEKHNIQIKNLFDKLDPQQKQALDQLYKELQAEMQELQGGAKEIMREMRYVYKDKEGIMRFRTRKSDPRLAKILYRLAKREKKTIKLEKKGETALEKLFKDEAGKKKNMKKWVNDLMKLGEEEIKLLKTELAEIKEIMHDINILHIHLIKKVYEESERELAELQKQGFPSLQLQANRQIRQNVAQMMHNNMLHLFKMSRYLKRETAKA